MLDLKPTKTRVCYEEVSLSLTSAQVLTLCSEAVARAAGIPSITDCEVAAKYYRNHQTGDVDSIAVTIRRDIAPEPVAAPLSDDGPLVEAIAEAYAPPTFPDPVAPPPAPDPDPVPKAKAAPKVKAKAAQDSSDDWEVAAAIEHLRQVKRAADWTDDDDYALMVSACAGHGFDDIAVQLEREPAFIRSRSYLLAGRPSPTAQPKFRPAIVLEALRRITEPKAA